MTTAGNAEPYLTIRPRSGWAALNFLEVWHFRDLLLSLAGRDLKLRYRQTALGVIWVILQPLIAAGILSFVFGAVAKLSSDGLPHFIFSFAGLLAWNAFNNTLSRSSTSLVGNAHLVSKVYFPRLVLPLSTLISTLVDFAVAMGMMIVLMICYRIAPQPGLLLLPILLLILAAMALGVGLYAAALMVSYRDIGYILPVFMPFLMWASPVGYSISDVPLRWRGWYMLNPLAGLIQSFRWSLLGRGEFSATQLIYPATVSVAVFVAGAFAFRRMERRFADVI